MHWGSVLAEEMCAKVKYISEMFWICLFLSLKATQPKRGDIQKSSWVIRWATLNKGHCIMIYGEDVIKNIFKKECNLWNALI